LVDKKEEKLSLCQKSLPSQEWFEILYLDNTLSRLFFTSHAYYVTYISHYCAQLNIITRKTYNPFLNRQIV
jgi:hypothetical protein